jgi:hypothetical protein
MPLPRRLVRATVVAAAMTVGLFVVGLLAAPRLLAWTSAAVGLQRLYLSSPADLIGVRLGVGAALALPPVAAWVALLLHRIRRGADASAPTALLYLGVPAAAVAGGIALRVLWMRATMRDVGRAGAGGFQAMFMAPDLSPHAWGLELGLLAGFAVCLVVWYRGPRR